METTLQTELIEKEVINTLSFSKKIIVVQHPKLMEQIEHAATLGNSYRSKVSIYFEDDFGPKRVDTTVWAFGDRYICLKGGQWLPISRIAEIKA